MTNSFYLTFYQIHVTVRNSFADCDQVSR